MMHRLNLRIEHKRKRTPLGYFLLLITAILNLPLRAAAHDLHGLPALEKLCAPCVLSVDLNGFGTQTGSARQLDTSIVGCARDEGVRILSRTVAEANQHTWVTTENPSAIDLKPLISRCGELLFQDDFEDGKFDDRWSPLHGTRWEVVNGAFQGRPSDTEYQKKQIAKGNRSHSGRTPSSRLHVPVDDCIVLFRFKLSDGLSGAHFGFNDGTFKTGTGHVCRLTLSTERGMSLQKDKNAKSPGDVDEILKEVDFNLDREKWYAIMIEVVGDQMVAQVSGGPVLKARHPRIDRPKDQINLPTRGGGTIYYDGVRVWKAVPKAGNH